MQNNCSRCGGNTGNDCICLDLSDHGNLYDEHLTVVAEKDATIARLEAENEVLREQNLMMNKSGVEKSARIKELADVITERDGEYRKAQGQVIALTNRNRELEAENDELSTQLETSKAMSKSKDETYPELLSIQKEMMEDRIKELEGLYHELIFAVAKKFEGESRHETALRYIHQAERNTPDATVSKAALGKGEK